VATRTLEPGRTATAWPCDWSAATILPGPDPACPPCQVPVALSKGRTKRSCGRGRLLLDEGIASPILVGNEAGFATPSEPCMRLDLGGVPWSTRRVARVSRTTSRRTGRCVGGAGHAGLGGAGGLRARSAFAAMMVASGDADMMVAGVARTTPSRCARSSRSSGWLPGSGGSPGTIWSCCPARPGARRTALSTSIPLR